MTPTIGFILLTHQKPYMILKLITKLNSMFDYPAIVCHHDFSKCTLSLDSSPGNVSFVTPHLETSFAEFSLVEATTRAIQQMYAVRPSPDWFVLLSGADYPIKSSRQILQDLSADAVDAYINVELIQANTYERPWQGLCHYRYCTKKPNPFSPEFKCFAGSQWFCANRRAAEYIVEFHTTKPTLASHYSSLLFTDESYFQCLLANAPHLRLSKENWRYTDWSAGGPHPKTLMLEDLPALLASRAHFARKFDIETDVRILDELDARTAG